MNDHPTLNTFVKRGRNYEVRHLLISGDDPGVKTLSKIVNGVEARIAVGTQYEMQKQEYELMKEWSGDGFEPERQAFESWPRTLTLLTAMNYHNIFDPKLVDMQRLNLTGRVSLAQWKGRSTTDGGEYEYALDGMTIIAQPKLPSNLVLNHKTTAEFVKAMQETVKLRDSLGPTWTFMLAD